MEFYINPKRLGLQDAAGMQIVQIIRELASQISTTGGVDPYNSSPANLGTASAGSSNKFARGDHVHAMPSASDVGALPAGLGITAASVGQFITISAVDANGVPTELDASTLPTGVQQGSVSIGTTWSGNGPYTQTVTVTGATVTSNSKVDLQPDATALAQLISDGVTALFVTNNNGTLTATAIGAATTAALTIQCTVTEVSA